MKEVKPSAIIYLDQNNLFHRYKKLDFKKLLNSIKKRFDVIRATAYNSYDYSNEVQKKFVTYLSNNGYRVKTVDCNIQTNIDNMLSCDMITENMSFNPDWIILISGDGDFAYPLDEISKNGTKVLVLGAKDNISLELLKVADEHIYIEDIEEKIILEVQ